MEDLKGAVRAEVTKKKKAMSEREVMELSLKLKDRFCKLSEYNDCECIFAYMSYNEEVRTNPIIEQAIKDGKRVAVPRTYASGNKKNSKNEPVPDFMEFIYIESVDECVPCYMGIPEPNDEIAGIDENGKFDASKARIADEKSVLFLMPGLAFDKSLNRIGYGGGFYDKYLDNHEDMEFLKVALCFDFQIYDALPVMDHDEKLDLVISPTIVIGSKDFA